MRPTNHPVNGTGFEQGVDLGLVGVRLFFFEGNVAFMLDPAFTVWWCDTVRWKGMRPALKQNA